MKKTLSILLIMLMVTSFAGAAESDSTRPFAPLLERTKRLGWEVDNHTSAAMFQKERARLGDRAAAAIAEVASKHADASYWFANYLSHPDYLNGSEQDLKLALLLLIQGDLLCQGHADLDIRARRVSINVNAAVIASRLGLHPIARSYKANAKAAIEESKLLRGGFPALGDEDRKVYDAIKLTP